MGYLYVVSPINDGVLIGFTKKYMLQDWLNRNKDKFSRMFIISVMRDGSTVDGSAMGTLSELAEIVKETGFWH